MNGIFNEALPKKISVLYTDVKREYYKTEEEYLSEVDGDLYAEKVAKYVRKMGIEATTIVCDENVSQELKKYKPDLVMNFVDSIRGVSSLGASVPGLLDVLGIPYTGAGVLGWSLGTNKFLMYQLMESSGIPVPSHQLVNSHTDMIDPKLRYPLFPKLNIEHSSIGVDLNSICENEKQLRAKIKDLISKHNQPILVDEFIAGFEVTASVLNGSNTKVYMVKRSTGGNTPEDIVTFDTKWKSYLGMSYEKFESAQLKDLVKRAFYLLKMVDYARIDIRVDQAGRFYFIDPNANPFFGPPNETHATYSIILDMYGISFEDTLRRLFNSCLKKTSEQQKIEVETEANTGA